MYNFDEIIDRKNTNSLKYDFTAERGKPIDILPMWVADMDFRIPPEVTKKLIKSVEHSIFGYTEVKSDYFDAIKSWFLKGFNYEIKESWLVKTPGVVYAICTAIRAFTKKKDSILIQTPVYYPFAKSIIANERNLIKNSLIYRNGRYYIDYDDFEKKIVENNVRLFILCSPHNPVGRVWTKEELAKIGEICIKYNVLVISDEIHCDFVYNGYKHHVYATLSNEFLNNSIICTAPSKTFNLAGLQVSNIFIANKDIKSEFENEIMKTGYSQLNTMGLIACQSAYESGREWLNELLIYLTGNVNYIKDFLLEKLPRIKLIEPQGTYLVWLDCKELGLSEDELDNLIVNKAGLWLDNGTMFGEEGEGFIRINIACPREIIRIALSKLQKVCP